jgi:hypothetical protein
MTGDQVANEMEHQVRRLRLTGQEPLRFELGPDRYAAYAQRANADANGSRLTILYYDDPSANVTDLEVRRVEQDGVIRVVPA